MIRTFNHAMTERRAELKSGENDKGFTLIELMVVIIIIGILAAIAIPVFLNQRQQAWDASAKSDLANAAIAAESYSVSNNGSYANMTKALLPGFKQNPDNIVSEVTVTGGGTGYTMTAYNKNSTATHEYTSTSGTITATGSAIKP